MNYLTVNKKKNMWMALWPCLFLLLVFTFRTGQSDITKTMGITQNMGATVPADIPFTDEQGKPVKFGDMLHGKPLIILPVFYSCKTGCALLIDSVIKTLAKATRGDILKPGRDMDIVMYSIDPKEDADLAHAKKALIFNSLTPHLTSPAATAQWRKETEQGWHLLTGNIESIRALSSSIGFAYNYRAVPDIDKRKTVWLINHPTCTVILTPQGKISSYTIGTDFQTREVEADLLVAKQEQIGRKADQSSMFGCIMLDPATGKNRVVIENVWRLAGILTVLGLAMFIAILSRQTKPANSISGGGLSLH